MCTAVSFTSKNHYFGRNLDLEYSYNETVTVTPRNYVFEFRKMGKMQSHFAMIGMACVVGGYPLYYDATNEKGLSMAGLNFPKNAHYFEVHHSKDNVTPFEFIPWVLGQCYTVAQARKLLEKTNLLNENFSKDLPLTPLHWIISDKECSVTVESAKQGLKIHDNPIGVLTNNPTFDYQMFNLNNYMSLTNVEPKNTFSDENGKLPLEIYSRGMGAMGLPGDYSSASRFVRAAFVKINSPTATAQEEGISQFFHILKSVEMPRGCVKLESGLYAVTLYSSCCDTEHGIYYYTTYENSSITAVDMHRENLQGSSLLQYPLKKQPKIEYQN